MLRTHAKIAHRISIGLLKAAGGNAFRGKKGFVPLEVSEFEGQTETSTRRSSECCARRSAAILGRIRANPRNGACATEHSDCRHCSARRARRHRRGCKTARDINTLPVQASQTIPVLQTRRPKAALLGARNRTAHQTISINERRHPNAW